MNEFETRANNIRTAIGAARYRVDNFGYKQDNTEETVSRIIGMFITWLTSTEEARHQDDELNGSFKKDVIDKLPEIDDPTWDSYIKPAPTSTLKSRVESLWGIRIAYTHGDGDISLIRNRTNKNYAIQAVTTFASVELKDDRLHINEGILHEAIRTFVQLRDILPT